MKFIFSIVAILLAFSFANAKTAVIQQKEEAINLANYVKIFEDKTGSININEAITSEYAPLKSDQINFQFSRSAFWLKFSFIKKTTHFKEIIFDTGNHFLEYVDIYYSPKGKDEYQHISIGCLGEKSISLGKHQSYTSIELIENVDYDFYVRIQSETPLRAPLHIRTLDNHIATQTYIGNLSWFFYGVALFLFLFGLFVYLSLRKNLYLNFLLSLLFLITYQLGYDNLYPAIEIFGQSDFLLKKMNTTIVWSIFFYLNFATLFLYTQVIPKWAKKTFNILKLITLVIAVIFIFHFKLGNQLTYIFAPIIWIAITIITSTLFFMGLKHVRFFALATLVLLGAVFMHVLTNLGYISSSIAIPQLAIKIGYMGQVLFFTIAIVDRYFLFQKNFTSILEEKVEERTTELESALQSLKTRQEQLIQAEKMSSIGILSAGVAHEINTPLNFVNTGLHLFESYYHDKSVNEAEKQEQINLSIKMMKEGVENSAEIVHSLMTFSNNGISQLKNSNINDLIDKTLLFIKSKIGQNINIEKDYKLNTPTPVFEDKMHQIIFNIINNAIEAIGHNTGTISINTKQINKPSRAQIEINNSGAQIEETVIGHIFEPFFTTKDPGKGTGLGLSTAYTYTQDHSGEIEAINTQDGVTFRVTIPS
ncbi:7TM-DISM domain-containing protein [Carboxylicivirga sp. N1Y90]|uniref:7TM-DISM domain-containing protein n=1 Tax=Carboxylicivirga fragile TaxID=3417571 RepID=UPI003D32C3CA|nr:GHKL domain-containing protein [Marinilabiliaceae bacterium N1Y90]